MTLISLNEDQETISGRFRKADYFVFVEGKKKNIVKNDHKTSKSKEFFEYFNTLGVDTIYLKELGYKTFLKLDALGVKVYFVNDILNYEDITLKSLFLISAENAENFCSLGHDKG